MKFIKKFFQSEETTRQLNNVNDLQVNDIIVLTDSFALPESLRQQEFQVTSINTYEFEHKQQLEWVLQGSNHIELYLTIESDDQDFLKFALKVQHDDVETLFDLDTFSQIFTPPGQAFLDKKADTELTQGWTSEQYQQNVFAKVGYFHRKDNRSDEISQYEGSDAGEPFELYGLLDQSQDKGIELEVWEDGDTDIFLILYRPLSDIVDMFPGS